MTDNDNKAILELLSLSERLREDRLYEITMEEVQQDEYDPASKARALEEASGDIGKAKSLYIKHRVRRLKDKLRAEQLKAEAHKQALAEEAKKLRAENEEVARKIREYNQSIFERKMFSLGKMFSRK